MDHWLAWLVFGAVVSVMMWLDLRVLQKRPHAISFKEAIRWTLAWIAVAALFNLYVWYDWGAREAGEFLTCYLTEYALSVDNMFVFLVIFTTLGVPAESQRRVLLWGILGALLMRGAFIFAGIELIERVAWTIYVLGGFLVLTGLKLAFKSETQVDPKKNPLLRFCRRFLRTTEDYEGPKFFVRRANGLWATPLFVALVAVESTDVLFAVDSVPAGLAITQNAPILYTSNILAILGLRSLYFAVAELIKFLRFLNTGLAAILVFVGVKMLFAQKFHIPVGVSLAVVGGLLALSVLASVIYSRLHPGEPKS